ncbi:MAG: DJ-1/PfpI family protein [Clostridiales bacterium]|nr:DJ-1/PfpI family protein [Clostridiales bacterium]
MDTRIALFIADGTEETEAIATLDLLRRAGIDTDLISIKDDPTVVTSHSLTVTADKVFSEIKGEDYDMLILPGGLKGTANFKACEPLLALIRDFHAQGKGLAAICAAPSVFSGLGILTGIDATSNPGFQEVIAGDGAILHADDKVVVSGNIITSQAMGTTVPFALAIIAKYKGQEVADKLKKDIIF